MRNWNVTEWVSAMFFVTFLGLLSLGQLTRIVLTPAIAIYAHDILVVVGNMFLLFIFRNFLKSRLATANLKKYVLEIGLGLWIIGGLGLAYFQGQSIMVALLYLLRLGSYFFFSWGMLNLSFWQKLPPTTLGLSIKSLGFLLTGLMIAYFGFLQYFLMPDTRILGILGWDTHYYRMIGTQLDPAFTGILLVLTLLLSLRLKKPVWLKWHVLFLLTIAVALTFSRASYLAFGIGLGFWAIKEWRQKNHFPLEILLIPLLLFSLPLLPKPGGEGVNLVRTSTISSRISNSQNNLANRDSWNWLVGRGLFVYQPDFNIYTQEENHARLPDNLVVLLLHSLGLVGCTLLLLVGLKNRWRFFKLSTPAQASILAVLVHSQFNNTLFQPFVWLFLWGIILSERNNNKIPVGKSST